MDIELQKSLADSLRWRCKNSADDIAIKFLDREQTYSEFDTNSNLVSQGLLNFGIKKDSRVAYLAKNSDYFFEIFYGALKSSSVVVGVNWRLAAEEVAYVLEDSKSEVLFVGPEFFEIIEKIKDRLPFLKHIISIDKDHSDWLSYKSWRNNQENKDPLSISEENDDVIQLYTSGTTGNPKGAVITNINIIHSCLHFQRHFSLSDKDNSILVVPASHVTGLVAHIMTMFFSGGTLILMKKFDVKEFLYLAEKEHLTYLIMVPAMYNLCLIRDDLSKYDLSSWRIGCFGGASMPLGTIKKLKSLLPNLSLVNAYGSTETCSPATLMPLKYKNNLIASVGKVVETGKIMIMNDNNEQVSIEETGELWIFGPMVIPGYWKNKKKTSEEFVNGYWKSGDIGYKDKNGYIYILDRKKDVINRGGYKIYSTEIENLISLSGLVLEVAVIPHMDPILGEKIHVIIYSDNQSKNLKKLQKLCSINLSEYKQPDYWTFLDSELPKNKNGKILKSLLIDEMEDKF